MNKAKILCIKLCLNKMSVRLDKKQYQINNNDVNFGLVIRRKKYARKSKMVQ